MGTEREISRRRWRRWRRSDAPAGPTSVEEVDLELQKALKKARAANAWTDVRLRRWLGFGALFLMASQMVTADVVFIVYGNAKGWEIPVSGIQVWLGATVVQVAVIVGAVAKYLFPPDGGGPNPETTTEPEAASA
ncbi:MAG TPA: hypothetical protein VNN15_00185 [Solirubrobacterales bacterium]|nr:hypothetical protein [Solirubrobacterales bacterium]